MSELHALLIKKLLILIKSVFVVSIESGAIMSYVTLDSKSYCAFKGCTKHVDHAACVH